MKFSVTIAVDGKRVYVPIPKDPATVWGERDRYHVRGTIDGKKIRGALEDSTDGYRLVLGPAWRRDCGMAAGDRVKVELEVEGPQADQLAADITAALDADPKARDFFASLATFYRKAYLRWIDATTRRPDVRAERIAEMVRLLRAGHKERPKG